MVFPASTLISDCCRAIVLLGDNNQNECSRCGKPCIPSGTLADLAAPAPAAQQKFREGDKVWFRGKRYDFGYYSATGKCVLFEEGERNMQDSFAVVDDNEISRYGTAPAPAAQHDDDDFEDEHVDPVIAARLNAMATHKKGIIYRHAQVEPEEAKELTPERRIRLLQTAIDPGCGQGQPVDYYVRVAARRAAILMDLEHRLGGHEREGIYYCELCKAKAPAPAAQDEEIARQILGHMAPLTMVQRVAECLSSTRKSAVESYRQRVIELVRTYGATSSVRRDDEIANHIASFIESLPLSENK